MTGSIECNITSHRKVSEWERRKISEEFRSLFASYNIDSLFIIKH